MRIFFCSLCITFAVTLRAQSASELPPHSASAAETNTAHSLNLKQGAALLPANVRPVIDVADFAYVLMSAEDGGIAEVAALRKAIASNLPDPVKLVILTTNSRAKATRKTYEQWLAPDRIIIASDNDANNKNGFWARDAFPVPVWNEDTEHAGVVGMQYFRKFSSRKTIAGAVKAKLTSHTKVFVGGNLLADEDGNCFAVNSSRLFGLRKEDLQNIYGCKNVHLLKYLSGIGDVDEVIKPIGGKRILTNTPAYRTELEAAGYSVVMLPAVANSYRTYANALIVGDTVFMPSYGIAKDQEAIAVYESLNYKVVPVRSNTMSDQLQGSIHCQTMAYPRIAETQLLQDLGVKLISP